MSVTDKVSLILKNRKTKIYTLVFLTLLIVIIPIVKRKMAIARERVPENYPVALEIVLPRRGVLKTQKTFLGLFKPENQASLSSRISASVTYIAEEGTAVKKGEVVVRLDTSDLAAAAEALDIKRQNQQKVYNRDKILFEHGAISQEQLENS